jgi:quercetin dioxygenase-like cupin family protein
VTLQPSTAVDPWRLSASRASHPSAQVEPLLGAGELLAQIASGLGGVVVPADLLGTIGTQLQRELLLTTPAYDVWLMNWPAGAAADMHSHDRMIAFHVVSGALVESRINTAGSRATSHREGATVVVPLNTLHRLESVVASTTVHVHAKDLS